MDPTTLSMVVSTVPTEAPVFAGAEAEEEPHGERAFDSWPKPMVVMLTPLGLEQKQKQGQGQGQGQGQEQGQEQGQRQRQRQGQGQRQQQGPGQG